MGELITCKTCSKCGEAKLHAEFYKDNKRKAGLISLCKLCVAENTAKYRSANPEKIKLSKSSWAARNLKKRNVSKSSWAARNPGKAKELVNAWRARNPERMKEIQAKEVLLISDSYVCRLLKISPKTATPELTELKREQLINTRLLRELKKVLTEQTGV
jgi:hypothetical protein